MVWVSRRAFKRIRTSLKYLFFILVIDVALLLSVELALRMFMHFPGIQSQTRDQTLHPWGWSNRPNDTIEFTPPMFSNKSIEIEMQTDAFGYRNKGFAATKPDDEYRILCMGDSSTFGWGVRYEDMYTVLLGDMLRREYPEQHISVYSMGIPGHTIVQGYILYREQVRAFDPDLITIAYGANDAVDITATNHPAPHIQFYLLHPDRYRSDNKNSAIKRSYIYNTMQNMPLMFRKCIANVPFLYALFFKAVGVPAVDIHEYKNILMLWRDEAVLSGTHMIVLCIGCPDQYSRQICALSTEAQIPFLDYSSVVEDHIEEIKHHQRFEEDRRFYAEAFGEQAIHESHYKRLYSLEGVHPTSIGHRLIAEELLREVRNIPSFQNRVRAPLP